MDEQSAPGPQGLKRKRSSGAQEAAVRSPAPAAAVTEPSTQPVGQPSNGPNGGIPNGVLAADGDPATTNGMDVETALALAGPDNPPQLDQSWRQHPDNKSFGKIIDRLAQQCYIDLNIALDKMNAEGQPEASVPKTNGLVPQAQPDTSEVSLKKKRILMEFAHEHRDRFTKTLVLKDWAGNVDGMAKFIDIKMWQEKQRAGFPNAMAAIANTKRNLLGFKVQAPNIEGAMELLATGKASWVPDMNYLPPKRLTAKQLLRTLRDMNVALSTRLNLHEELPPHMQEYSIANGRATFTVRGEFAVDLAIVDEETTSPFYFIDLRFLFTPSSSILNDQVRGHLEAESNRALAAKGLQGCYDFLHNFVLTHKVNVLKNQSGELIRGEWFDCIKVEHLRRSLVVQYWAGMPGTKSWIEIGISSGRTPGMSEVKKRKATPCLSVRWFRKGQEVRDEKLDFDWETLDLEKCLMIVIGKHCFGKLGVAHDGLRTLAADMGATKGVLEAGVETSLQDMTDCTLKLRLPSMPKALNIRMEPVTGSFSISSPTPATQRSERILNSDPTIDVSRALATLICSVVQERVHKLAELLDWRQVRNLGSVKPQFGTDVWQRTVFHMPGWGQQWALGVSFGLGGEKWWVVQLQENKTSESSRNGLMIVTTAKELPVREMLGDKAADVSRETLLSIERLAVAEVSFVVLSQQLKGMKVPHQSEKPSAVDGTGTTPRQQDTGAMWIHFNALMRDPKDKMWKAWAHGPVRLSHQGVEYADIDPECEGKQSPVQHDLRLSLEPGRMKHLHHHIKGSRGADVVVNASGGLAIRFRTSFGEPFVKHIREKLRSLERLDHYLTVLHKAHCSVTAVSMAKLSFTYRAAEPTLRAHLSLPDDGAGLMKLRLEPADVTPHQRIRVMLEKSLNDPARPDPVKSLVYVLGLTLPVLQTLDRLESAHMAKRTAVVRATSALAYSVAYKAPLPVCTVSVAARMRQDGIKQMVQWHIQVSSVSRPAEGAAPSILPEPLAKALKALWKEKGEGWMGLGSGAVANVSGVGAALERVDEVVRGCDGLAADGAQPEPSASAADANGTVPLSQQAPQQQQTPSQLAKEAQKKPAVAPNKPANGAGKPPNGAAGKPPAKATAAKKRDEPEYITLD